MKFVYVLTTDGSNYLTEQAYLSQFSLKLFNPEAEILTLVDQDTFSFFSANKNKLLEKTSMLVKVDCPPKFTMKQRSRCLKLTMRKHVKGDFVFIDSDTIICADLSELFKMTASIAQVYDLHVPYKNNIFLQNNTIPKIQKSKLQYQPEEYFNSGLIYTKDDEISHTFFKEAFNAWKSYQTKDFCIDQPAFNYANHQMNYFIKELDGVYNCQITENGLKYLSDAKIIHYFNTTNNSTFLLAHNSLLEEIRKNGLITDSIKKKIENARNQFADYSIILTDINKIAVYNSRLFSVSLSLYKRARTVFNIFNKFFTLFYK